MFYWFDPVSPGKSVMKDVPTFAELMDKLKLIQGRALVPR